MTKEIIDGGLITADGTFISGDMVIITIGESPDLGYLPEGVRKFRDWVIPGADMSLLENVFAAGCWRTPSERESRRLRPLTPRFTVWPMRPSRRNRYPQGN